MTLSPQVTLYLNTALANPGVVKELVTAINAASAFASPAGTVAALGTTTNITAVPGSFADVDAVQAYLAAAGVVPRIESRLDAVEAKVDAVIASLKLAGLMSS